jgi:SAM-dependent methyltransferase
MQLTGERTMPGIWHENYWLRRHEAAYLAVAPLATGRRVLDAGAGEGFGPALLREAMADVVGLELSPEAAAHALTRYQVSTAVGNVVTMPFVDGGFDSLVSMQTVEHIWDQSAFVAECARVLRPNGLLAMSTPNRLTFSPSWQPGDAFANPFHHRELDADELAGLLADHFHLVELVGLRHGPRLEAWEQSRGSLVEAQLASTPDQWSQDLRSLVASVTADDFALTPDDVSTSLDLIVIAERPA